MIRSVVIVGAGQAGYHAAAALRHDGFDGTIALVGDEPGLPYQRPPLSKGYLLGTTRRDSLELGPERFYAVNRIELIHDAAVAIDRMERRVRLRSGASLSYDHLILALGAHNRRLPVPGADLDGVMSLRTLAEADLLLPRLAPAQRVVVAGAGFIGLELAATAVARGASVHVIELAERPMARAVTPAMAGAFVRLHALKGVRFTFGQGLAAISGSAGRVAAVATGAGEWLPADTVIVGIGILPNVALAAEAGLAVENGVKVDHRLLTSDAAISAIGDCTSFPSPRAGINVRLESVQNATDQGRAVAARIAGKSPAYDPVPWFWSDQYDRKLQIAGLHSGHDATVIIGDAPGLAFSVLCFKGERLVAVESLNRAGDHMAARRLLARAVALTPHAASVQGFDLRALEAGTR